MSQAHHAPGSVSGAWMGRMRESGLLLRCAVQRLGALLLLVGLLPAALAAEPAPLSIPEGNAGSIHAADAPRALQAPPRALGGGATAVRKAALETGRWDAGGPARALIAPARQQGELAEALLAVRLAPDLPLAHVALASVHWQDAERGKALRSLLDALLAVPRNLEATLWLASSLLVLLSVVLVLGSSAFIAMCGASGFARAAHDLGDLVSVRMPAFARAALLASVVLLPVALGEGWLGLVIGLFAIGLLYGSTRQRMALVLASVLLGLGSFPIAQVAGRALSMLSADPVAESAFAVRQGIQSDADIELLRVSGSAGDLFAIHALAAHASQQGEFEEALERYQALADQLPRDPVIATNLANLHFRRGDFDRAVAYYQIASTSLESPVLWFNLSQAYARSFRMAQFETAISRAQELDSEIVGELSLLSDSGFVADLPLPIGAIRSRMLAASRGGGFARTLRAPFAPGWLGRDWRLSSTLLLSLLAGSAVLARRFEPASACSRCGTRVCARCDGTVWDHQTCDNCHRLFHHPKTTDPALRAARLEQLRRRAARVERAARLGSFAVPGLGGVLADRPDLGFLAVLCFGWAVASVVLRSGVVPDPLVLGAAGPLVLVSSAIVAAFAYAGLVAASAVIRRSQ